MSENKGSQWLTTFNDLVTLLMVFFVLVFTMSRIDVEKMMDFQDALQSGLGVLLEGNKAGVGIRQDELLEGRDVGEPNVTETIPSPVEPPEDLAAEEEALSALQSVAEEFMKRMDESGVEAISRPDGIALRLSDEVMFPSGSATINRKALPLLDEVCKVLAELPNRIRVEGHTDNDPISTGRFPSNWELSTARAVNVLRYLLEEGGLEPEKLSAVGYGAAKPRVPNTSPENKAKNRRVVIVAMQ